MKIKNRVLPALILSLFAATAAPSASAQQFSGVFVFGDSLSDAGYYRPFLASLGMPASLVSILGRFTTSPGPVWSEVVSNYYGYAPAPSNVSGGNIYAQGGARVAVSSTSTPPGAAQRPVSTQVSEYLSTHGGTADPNALYAIWAGANDVFQTLQGAAAGTIPVDQLPTIMQNTAGAEIQQIARLQAAGARYIVVFGLPNIGVTPAFASSPANSAAATQLSAGFNTALFAGLAQNGIRVIPIDAFAILSQVGQNPAAFGFTNTTTPACGPFPPFSSGPDALFCPPQVQAPGGAQHYLYADGVHPTTASHAIIANIVEAMIGGPAAYSMLAETPIHTRASHVRTLTDALAQGSGDRTGGWNVFVTLDGSRFDADMAAGKAGSHNKAVTVGATARISDGVIMGGAVGKNRADGSFGGDMGGYGTDEIVFSLMGSARWGGLYGNAVLSVSNIDYRGVHRNVPLGPVVLTGTAQNPSGSNQSAFFELGYDFRTHGFAIGPTISVTAQDVDVNSFTESADLGAMALHIGSQRRKSEVWSAGARASYTMGNWTPWLRITADKERKDDPRVVTATPVSLATGNSFDVPAYNPDNSYVTTWIGIAGSLDERIGLSLSYYYVSGRSGVKEDGLSALVSYRF